MHKIGKLLRRSSVVAVEIGSCVLVINTNHQWNQNIIWGLKTSEVFIREVRALEIERQLCFVIFNLFCILLSYLLFTLFGLISHLSLKRVPYDCLRIIITDPRYHRLWGVFLLVLSALKILFIFISLVLVRCIAITWHALRRHAIIWVNLCDHALPWLLNWIPWLVGFRLSDFEHLFAFFVWDVRIDLLIIIVTSDLSRSRSGALWARQRRLWGLGVKSTLAVTVVLVVLFRCEWSGVSPAALLITTNMSIFQGLCQGYCLCAHLWLPREHGLINLTGACALLYMAFS